MSGNTSVTGGYVTPTTSSLEDDDLTNAFQAVVVGITGLDPTLVRPRWQPQPPTQPPVTTNWCALGITKYEGVDYPQLSGDPSDSGSSNFGRLERIDLLVTFYGPQAASLSGLLRDGLYVWQNTEMFGQYGVKLRSADDMIIVPELINSQYVYRSDLHCSFMRMINRVYPVGWFVGAQVTTETDSGLSCVENISQETQ